MNVIQNSWFSEIQTDLWPGQSFSLKVRNIIHEEKSKYQNIQILETESYGRCLVLDGIIQCTSRDEFSYQEMISFLPLCAHPNPKKVLIVGGGDGGVAREVVKHPLVEEVYQVEIDERVVELSKLYLPNMSKGFDSRKVKLVIGDGFSFMEKHESEFDVIITDSSDPIGPAVSLFEESYYSLLKRALRGGGIICSQGESFWLDCDYVKSVLNKCKTHFPKVGYAITSIPSYPCGHIGFIIASLNEWNSLKYPTYMIDDQKADDLGLKYYSKYIHESSFILPRWVTKHLFE